MMHKCNVSKLYIMHWDDYLWKEKIKYFHLMLCFRENRVWKFILYCTEFDQL